MRAATAVLEEVLGAINNEQLTMNNDGKHSVLATSADSLQ
jgi:hypothetical protein